MRDQGTLLGDLIGRESFALLAELRDLRRNIDHAPGSLKLVVAALNRYGDFFLQALQVLLGLGKLRPSLAHGSPPLAEVPQCVVQVSAHGAKVADEERNTVLAAVAPLRTHILQVRRFYRCSA